MTFRDVAIKNFKGNILRYITYFLCNSFIIMTFFMYSTLMFNEKLSNSSEIEKGVIDVFIIPSTVLLVFSIIFISYTHFTFIKARKKEFGIFMNLGMSIKDIRKIILYENYLIGASSMILGTISGLIFSRLFFLVIINLLDVTGVEYSIGFKNFSYSIGIFAVLFLVNLAITIMSTSGFEIIKLLKTEREIRVNRFNSPFLGISALVIIIGFSIRLYSGFSRGDANGRLLFESIVIICISLYVVISQLGGTLLKIVRKNKKTYYKKMLLVTSLNSKFNANKKIIFITSILIGVTVFYAGFILNFYLSAEKNAIRDNSYDITYFQIGEKNKISSKDFEKIVIENNEKITKQRNLEFLYYYGSGEEARYDILVSEGEISKVIKDIGVRTGEYTLLNQIQEPKNHGNNGVENYLELNEGNTRLENSSEIFKKVFVSRHYQFNRINVLNNDDYKNIKEENKGLEIGRINLYNLKSWKSSGRVVAGLEGKLKNNNINKKAINIDDEYLKVESKIGSYKYDKQSSSILLFTFSYLGIFFFASTSIVLFLKILSDIDSDRKRFESIYRIGVTAKEIKSQISKELLPLFFIGPFIGLTLACIFTISFGGDSSDNTSTFLYCNLVIFVAFMVMQTIYFNLCRNKYFRLLRKGKYDYEKGY